MKTFAQRYGIPVAVIFMAGIVSSCIFSGLMGSSCVIYGSEWKNLSGGRGDEKIRTIAVNPLDTHTLFIGTPDGIFKSSDGGTTWNVSLDLSGAVHEFGPEGFKGNEALVKALKLPVDRLKVQGSTALAIDPANPQRVYAGTVQGLYASSDEGKSWEKMAPLGETMDPFVVTITIDPSNPEIVYAGTLSTGLLSTLNGGVEWTRTDVGGSRTVGTIAVHPFDSKVAYAGTPEGIFKSTDGAKTWMKQKTTGIAVGSVAVSQVNPAVVYALTPSSLYKSINGGVEWKQVGNELFAKKRIYEVALSPAHGGMVYVTASDGVYGSVDGGTNWQDLSVGVVREARSLTCDPVTQGVIWVASDNGVFKTAVDVENKNDTRESGVGFAAAEEVSESREVVDVIPERTEPDEEMLESITIAGDEQEGPEIPAVPSANDVTTILQQFAHEPTVQEIQEVAMRFAEVHPDIIEGWRKGAKWRALLPKFSITYDHALTDKSYVQSQDQGKSRIYRRMGTDLADDTEISPNTGTTLEYDVGYSEYSYFQDEITTYVRLRSDRQKDRDYSIEFEWELGDFLYNPDQVRISDEARDLVELRNDVLEEVTQFYFQRRQLQIDLLLSPPDELRERLRLELQLQEVTANLDYLTGGYLTLRINESREKKDTAPSLFKRVFNM